MIPYPSEVPINEVQTVIATIRTRSLDNAPEFAKAVWTIAGFALLQTAGEMPQSFGAVGSSGSTSMSNEEACGELQTLLDSASQPGVAQALPPINWKRIASWALQLLLTFVA